MAGSISTAAIYNQAFAAKAGRASYIFNPTIAGIEQADALLIVGSNPRKEAAVLNSRIRKRWRTGQLKVGVIGAKADLTYDYDYLGAGTDTLTDLAAGKHSFADVLKEAQAKGYAEADPTFDIGGFDTAHKLALLTSLAFGTRVAFDQIDVEGIEGITQADIEAAEDLGYRIKLLGVALETESGIEQRVHPAMVPQHSAIAEVSGVTNCVAIDGDSVGNLLLVGPGAGAAPTASAVMGDILDIARGTTPYPFRVPAARLKPYTRATLGRHHGAYYVRLAVYDRSGAMAGIAGRMGERHVSLESIVQRRPRGAQIGINARGQPGTPTPVILITHETTEEAIRAALDAIHRDGHVSEVPQMIRIEPL